VCDCEHSDAKSIAQHWTRKAPLASQHTGCSSRLLSRQLVAVNTLTRTGWHPRRAPPRLEHPLSCLVLDSRSVLACGAAGIKPLGRCECALSRSSNLRLSLNRGDARTASERSWPGAEARASGPLALVVRLPDRGCEHPTQLCLLVPVGIKFSGDHWRTHWDGWSRSCGG